MSVIMFNITQFLSKLPIRTYMSARQFLTTPTRTLTSQNDTLKKVNKIATLVVFGYAFFCVYHSIEKDSIKVSKVYQSPR